MNCLLVVEEVLDLTVDLESSFSSITPGNSLSLQYTIENLGNADLELSPRMQLPQGWIQNSVLEDLTLGWTESQNFIISVTADTDARSGQIAFILDSIKNLGATLRVSKSLFYLTLF